MMIDYRFSFIISGTELFTTNVLSFYMYNLVVVVHSIGFWVAHSVVIYWQCKDIHSYIHQKFSYIPNPHTIRHIPP